ncbi:hypothetical protein CPLU01_02349 [Colletotrichum plurivorum]|uniref:Hydrophobin n=1 Tax=Colletotrichum plurivorum TaxID=2175906 RepID=A0A8H6NMS6_9PEZI|nr:hypothetical protein CPLU01_02349 [Colletotrichum plurivorum]
MRLLHSLFLAILLLYPASALPNEPRLINVSPEISPKLDLSDSLSCLGVAVCNPVTVDKNARPSGSAPPQLTQQQAPPQAGGSLVNVAPVVSPNVDLSGLLSCVGVANCNPVTVNKGPVSS